MAKTDIQKQLDIIGGDILNTLHESSIPLTQSEIYHKRSIALTNRSEFGYSFALEKLEAKKKIRFVSPDMWEVNHG